MLDSLAFDALRENRSRASGRIAGVRHVRSVTARQEGALLTSLMVSCSAAESPIKALLFKSSWPPPVVPEEALVESRDSSDRREGSDETELAICTAPALDAEPGDVPRSDPMGDCPEADRRFLAARSCGDPWGRSTSASRWFSMSTQVVRFEAPGSRSRATTGSGRWSSEQWGYKALYELCRQRRRRRGRRQCGMEEKPVVQRYRSTSLLSSQGMKCLVRGDEL